MEREPSATPSFSLDYIELPSDPIDLVAMDEVDSSSDQPSSTTGSSASCPSSDSLMEPPLALPPDHNTLPFVCTKTIFEDHGKVIYAASFNPFLPSSEAPLLAVAGANRVTLYRCPLRVGEFDIVPVCTFVDPSPKIDQDLSAADKPRAREVEKDSFYAVGWCLDRFQRKTFIVAGGENGVLRVIDVGAGRIAHTMRGHGNVINEIRLHPSNSLIFATASKDQSTRLWNVRLNTPLAVFAGFTGHSDQVLSLDWSQCGMYLVTGSMDHTVRIWRVTEEVQQRMEATSNPAFDLCKTKQLPEPIQLFEEEVQYELEQPLTVQWNLCKNGDVHTNYVDCVRTHGNFIISKSSECTVQIWKFGDFEDGIAGLGDFCPIGSECSLEDKAETSVSHLAVLNLPAADTWFMKFDIDPHKLWLVCGTRTGDLHCWKLGERIPSMKSNFQFAVTNCSIRQVCFERHGRLLVAVADDGSVSRIDRISMNDTIPRERKPLAKPQTVAAAIRRVKAEDGETGINNRSIVKHQRFSYEQQLQLALFPWQFTESTPQPEPTDGQREADTETESDNGEEEESENQGHPDATLDLTPEEEQEDGHFEGEQDHERNEEEEMDHLEDEVQQVSLQEEREQRREAEVVPEVEVVDERGEEAMPEGGRAEEEKQDDVVLVENEMEVEERRGKDDNGILFLN